LSGHLMSCLFCQIVDKKVPAKVVRERGTAVRALTRPRRSGVSFRAYPLRCPDCVFSSGSLASVTMRAGALTRAGARAATGGNIVSVTATQAFEASIGACPVP